MWQHWFAETFFYFMCLLASERKHDATTGYALAALLQNRPLQTDSFWSSGNGGRLLHSGNMKATTTELRGQIERFKVPNIKEINYVRFSNGSHLGSAVLDFLNFPEPWKISKNDQRVIKTNKRIRKSY